jgi:hypothetical protein
MWHPTLHRDGILTRAAVLNKPWISRPSRADDDKEVG